MSSFDRVEAISRIYEKLIDDESRNLFNARLDYVFDRSYDTLRDQMWKISDYKYFSNYQIEKFYENHNKMKNIIFGAGKYGRQNRYLLERFGVKISFFCDNDSEKTGTIIDGIKVLGVDDVCQNYRDYNVIPISPHYRKDMFDQLIADFFPQENILYLRRGVVDLVCEKQYFDFDAIRPKENNVFVDAGCYNGQTTLDYIDWCKGSYEKIFCFEPNFNNYKSIKQKFGEDKNVEVINAGTWSKETDLGFAENGPASKIVEGASNNSIHVKTIDQVVKDAKVTYIKMDVEGAEFESIQGAENTIINNKPDLAVCIYHKKLDFIDLPKAILDIVPEYKFAIRHYSNNTTETVLYAFVDSGLES